MHLKFLVYSNSNFSSTTVQIVACMSNYIKIYQYM